jgi:hypothetical protein
MSRVDTGSVRKEDLDKLVATPVPNLSDGVRIKYIYPELPNY